MLDSSLFRLFFRPLILMALAWMCACGDAATALSAERGVLDLTGIDLESQGPIRLNGEWEFYWRQLLEPADFIGDRANTEPAFFKVPAAWNGREEQGQLLGGDGFATFRLRVRLPVDAAGAILALRIPEQGSSHQVFADGRPVARNGVVAENAERARAQFRPLMATLHDAGREIEIVVQIANFADQSGGFWYPLVLGTEEQIRDGRDRDRITAGVLWGALMIMGLYHLALFALRRRESAAFFFGLVCILMSVRMLVTGERLLIQAYPELPFEFFITLEYFAFYSMVPVFVWFVAKLFPALVHRRVVQTILVLGFGCVGFVLLTPPAWFTRTVGVFQAGIVLTGLYILFVGARGILHGSPSALSFFLGTLLFFGCIINDILYNFELIATGYIAHVGLFLFIFAQSAILAGRFSRAFHKVEELSVELEAKNQETESLNRDLDHKVQERTKQLTSLLQDVRREREKSDRLLLNILPSRVADELKLSGEVQPIHIDSVTVLFTDFVGFTTIAEHTTPAELIRELDGCFTQFDEIVEGNQLEKLKTIGDAYMCAGGLPEPNRSHPVDACLAALEFQALMKSIKQHRSEKGLPFWSLRAGLHTGAVTAGVVGKNKFAYDIWGDTVNTASRMESGGEPERINISDATYRLVSDFFVCEHRGKIEAKGKGKIDMYFLEGIRPELREEQDPRRPNERFRALYDELSGLVPAR